MAESDRNSTQGGSRKVQTYVVGSGNIMTGGQVNVVEMAVAAGTLGPFVSAFCTELGKRFGGTVADWVSHVRLLRRRDSSKAELLLKLDDDVTVVELEEELSDEARLALLELDIRAQAVRGRRLRWDAAAGTWVPVEGKYSEIMWPPGASAQVSLWIVEEQAWPWQLRAELARIHALLEADDYPAISADDRDDAIDAVRALETDLASAADSGEVDPKGFRWRIRALILVLAPVAEIIGGVAALQRILQYL